MWLHAYADGDLVEALLFYDDNAVPVFACLLPRIFVNGILVMVCNFLQYRIFVKI